MGAKSYYLRVVQSDGIERKCKLISNNVKKTLIVNPLPSEYQEVEYIESTGTQYIDTGYIHKATTKIDIVCDIKSTAESYDYRALFGARNFDFRSNSFNFFTIFNEEQIPVFSRSGNEAHGTGLIYDEKILISAYDKTCTWYRYGSLDAAGSVTTTGTADDGFNKMLLFCLNRSREADTIVVDRPPVEAKIYGCKIWDAFNITLARDFVPCYRKSDNKTGMYDLVNKNFHPNPGTGEFVLGNNV